MKVLVVESNLPDSSIDDVGLFRDAVHAIDPDVEITSVKPYAAPVTARDLDGVDGVIFSGSAVNWGVDDPRAAPLRDAAERVFDARIPTYGSCNGAQLAAHLLGGAVGPSDRGAENGLALDIRLTDEGRAHPFLIGRQDGFAVPAAHYHEITRLPEGAVLLAGNAHSPVQAFAYEQDGLSFWGVQYHPEITPELMAEILPQLGDTPGHVCADYRACETDAGAARRLGAAPGDLQPGQRITEIRNWLKSLET